MIQPFFIFCLPRSRSYWLSQWLGCGHDLGLEASSIEDWALRALVAGGSVETGSAEHWRAIRKIFPKAKFLVIIRDLEDVEASLAKLGLHGFTEELVLREEALMNILRFGEGEEVDYYEIGDVHTAKFIWDATRPNVPFDFHRWLEFKDTNLQLDLPKRLSRLAERTDEIVELRTAAKVMPDFVWCGQEDWASMAREGLALAKEHFDEANALAPLWYQYNPNEAMLEHLYNSGVLKIWTARINCELVGYIFWTLSMDVEASPQIIADQGAWFIKPMLEKHSNLGLRLLSQSIDELRASGINSLHLHHPTSGRGSGLGRYFKSLGAKHTQTRYTLWLGPKDA